MEPQLTAMFRVQPPAPLARWGHAERESPLHHVWGALPKSACPQKAASARHLSATPAAGPTSHVAKHRSLRISALGKFLSGLGETLSILSFLRVRAHVHSPLRRKL